MEAFYSLFHPMLSNYYSSSIMLGLGWLEITATDTACMTADHIISHLKARHLQGSHSTHFQK